MREDVGAVPRELRGREIVRARLAEVDDGDGLVGSVGGSDETIAGVHHERRADDEECIGPLDLSIDRAHSVLRDGLAEKHDVGLQHPAASTAIGHAKRIEFDWRELGISIRAVAAHFRSPGRVGPSKRRLESAPGDLGAARQAANTAKRTMKVDHAEAPGLLMQAIDVLRH